jgi:hypothetical protein
LGIFRIGAGVKKVKVHGIVAGGVRDCNVIVAIAMKRAWARLRYRSGKRGEHLEDILPGQSGLSIVISWGYGGAAFRDDELDVYFLHLLRYSAKEGRYYAVV